jgi:hypothetical protein
MAKYLLGKWTVEECVAQVHAEGSVAAAARAMQISRESLKCFLKGNGAKYNAPVVGRHTIDGKITRKQGKEDTRPLVAGVVNAFDSKRTKLKGKRFVFTSAQNNTHVHKNFFASLQTFCAHNKAELHISRFAYNKGGFQNDSKDSDDLWYDPAIAPYVLDSSAEVSPGLIFCGELDILPTAANPLSGFDSYCGGSSGIIPHAKVAMQSLPRLKGEDARFLYTTGAVTLINYIQRKAGQKAEFHHVYGALYVEVDAKGEWFARQLIADSTGEFYDLTTHYSPKGATPGKRVQAINWGDIHIEKEDRDVSKASWGMGSSMLRVLCPHYQFVHDLTDFSARNHHNINDPYFIADRFFRNEQSVEENLKLSADFLDKIQKIGKVIVVESNHHEAYERWLRTAEIQKDPANAEFYHESNARLFRAIRTGEDFDIYEWALRKHKELKNVTFLKGDASFTIGGESGKAVECGLHGHRGINGARGSSRAFRSVGKRVNVGHSHSAGIFDGVYCAGVSGLLDMGYNKGPSSWSHSHIITYANGKRAIVTIKNGKWRA